MPNARKITTRDPAKNAKPAKPAKQADKPAKAATAKPVTSTAPVAPAVARVPANITRTIATIDAQRTNFGARSDRDNAYIRFYAGFAKRDNGTVTVQAIVAADRRPAYNGSNKPHDAGVIVRLIKAGILTGSAGSFSFAPAILSTAETTNADVLALRTLYSGSPTAPKPQPAPEPVKPAATPAPAPAAA